MSPFFPLVGYSFSSLSVLLLLSSPPYWPVILGLEIFISLVGSRGIIRLVCRCLPLCFPPAKLATCACSDIMVWRVVFSQGYKYRRLYYPVCQRSLCIMRCTMSCPCSIFCSCYLCTRYVLYEHAPRVPCNAHTWAMFTF